MNGCGSSPNSSSEHERKEVDGNLCIGAAKYVHETLIFEDLHEAPCVSDLICRKSASMPHLAQICDEVLYTASGDLSTPAQLFNLGSEESKTVDLITFNVGDEDAIFLAKIWENHRNSKMITSMSPHILELPKGQRGSIKLIEPPNPSPPSSLRQTETESSVDPTFQLKYRRLTNQPQIRQGTYTDRNEADINSLESKIF